jgi:hypothetical protein
MPGQAASPAPCPTSRSSCTCTVINARAGGRRRPQRHSHSVRSRRRRRQRRPRPRRLVLRSRRLSLKGLRRRLSRGQRSRRMRTMTSRRMSRWSRRIFLYEAAAAAAIKFVFCAIHCCDAPVVNFVSLYYSKFDRFNSSRIWLGESVIQL